MRLILFALFAFAVAAAPVRASDCVWTVVPDISPPDQKQEVGDGTSYPSFWAWGYVVSADHMTIFGSMTSFAYHCTTNLAASAAGNGTYVVMRIKACCHPSEDIEGTARNEFTARAELNDDSYAHAQGSQRIKASKLSLDCHACGGVEATSSGYGDGSSGTLTVQAYPGGPNMVIHWSKGAAIEQAFQDSDGGEGGKTPEVVTCQTNLALSTSVGWWDDSGFAIIKGSKAELKVWGTCDGCCAACVLVIDVSIGY